MKYLVWEEKMNEYKDVTPEELEKFRKEKEYEYEEGGYLCQIDVVKFEKYEDGKMYFIVETFER